MTTNDSTNFPTIFCSTWWTGCYEGSERVKYWWHPDDISAEQFRAHLKKCVVEAIEAWLASDEDWYQFQYLPNINEDSEHWQHWLENDVVEGRMADLGYRKCKNLVFAALPIDDPTTSLDPGTEEWKKYLGTELYGRIEERNARREAREEVRFRAEREKEELRKKVADLTAEAKKKIDGLRL